MIPYLPNKLVKPPRLIEVSTAWQGCESALEDILERFRMSRMLALEFGVFWGYSAAALANYFDTVIGVDTFRGDKMAGGCDYHQTRECLRAFPNISLCMTDYRSFIENAPIFHADLVHVDILHTFEDTYACGRWAAAHADVVLFHDTLSYSEVYRAVMQIASETGMSFYNWEQGCGLGILSRSVP